MSETVQGEAKRICYRCSKEEQTDRPLRLLPGSTYITLCPACYEVIWGWHEKPAPLEQPKKIKGSE